MSTELERCSLETVEVSSATAAALGTLGAALERCFDPENEPRAAQLARLHEAIAQAQSQLARTEEALRQLESALAQEPCETDP